MNQPLQLGSSAGSSGREFYSFGFPLGKSREGLAAVARALAETEQTGHPILQLKSTEITQGFSGAALFDKELLTVIGVVSSVLGTESIKEFKIRLPVDPQWRNLDTCFGRPIEAVDAICGELVRVDECPYRSLEYFRSVDADFYFGRETATLDMVKKLEQNRFVAVVGVSGSGKSSLVRAGLAKGLREIETVGLKDRQQIVIAPTANPILTLCEALASLPDVTLADVAKYLDIEQIQKASAFDPARVTECVRAFAGATGLLITVDQFERLFIECKDKSNRQAFINVILLLSDETMGGVVKILISVRADYYGPLFENRLLGDRVTRSQVTLTGMSEQKLRETLIKPAEKRRLKLESGLADLLVADVKNKPADLPLLQLAISSIWKLDHKKGMLTVASYHALNFDLGGGVVLKGARGAVAHHAMSTWLKLDKSTIVPEKSTLNPVQAKDAARRLLLRLVVPGSTSSAGEEPQLPTGRSICESDLDESGRNIADFFVRERILIANWDNDSHEASYRVVHEALFWAWPQLRTWIEREDDFLRWQERELVPRLAQWKNSKSRSDLLSGVALQHACAYRSTHRDLLEGAKLEFINRSVRRHLARRGFWVLGAIVIIGLLAYLAATSSQRAILRSRSFYESAQRSLVERDYASAEIAATDALIDEDRFSTRQTLLDSRVLAFRKTWEVRTKSVLAVCSDGTVGALKQNENQIEFVSINSNNMLFAPPLEPSTITRATFGSSGNLLVYGTRDGHVRRWDPISKRLDSPNSLPNNHEIASVACSADGAEVLFCTEKGPEPLGKAELWIWHTSSGSIERVAETDSIYWALAWDSTDDRFVAGGNDYAITLFEKKEGEWVKQYQSVVADDVIATVSFSPDGTNIITAGSDNLVRLLDAKTGVEIRRFTGHLNDVLQAQFIDDGSLIVSAGYDGTVKIWDTVSGVNLWTIRLNESISSFSVSADDKLTVGCERGCISVFQRSGSGLYRRLGDCGSPCSVVQLQPGTSNIFVATQPHTSVGYHSSDSIVNVYDTSSGNLEFVIYPHCGQINAMAFDRSGSLLALAGNENSVQIWKPTNPSRLFKRVMTDKAQQALCFDDQGRLLCGGWGQTFGIVGLSDLALTNTLTMRMFPYHTDKPDSNQSVFSIVGIPGTDNFLTGGGSGCLQRFNTTSGERVWATDDALEMGREE